jgi:hypothetical protein
VTPGRFGERRRGTTDHCSKRGKEDSRVSISGEWYREIIFERRNKKSRRRRE